MYTAEKVMFGNKGQLPSGCVLPQLKSLFLAQATRNAGQALYEILGMAELMRVAYEKGELESLQNRLASLLSDGADLAGMLSDIIELSRLEAEPGEQAIVHFNIVALLQDVAQATRTVIGQKPVTVMDVSAPGPVVVLSDPGKIRQIMTGLANNAATFTDRGRITLIFNRDEDRIRLTVTDTGRGMTAEEISRFFGDDREYDGEVTAYAESGLELRIVKALVALLGGNMSVSSKLGEGTIVTVSLPLGPSGNTHNHGANG